MVSLVLDLSIVIPTYNQVAVTAQCFASIARIAKGLRYEVIVVDNGSTDATISYVMSHTPGQLRGKAMGETPPKRVRILHNTIPRLLSRSWNMGFEAAIGRHVIITNNDVVFSDGALHQMIHVADRNEQAGIVIPMGPLDYRAVGAPKLDRFGNGEPYATVRKNFEAVDAFDKVRRRAPGEAGYVPDPYLPQGNYCFLLTRRAWETTGPFDERFMFTGEDWEWNSRMRRHWKIVRALDAFVAHYEHLSGKELGGEYWERLIRNRFLLTEIAQNVKEFFSIVMPVYNRVESLREAINSVIAQTFPHWRLYVVDDCSERWDEIMDLAKEYELEAGRIGFFHRNERGGPGTARNQGIAYSRGKYVAFLDSDDIWYPNHLQRHFDVHEGGNWAMVYSSPDFAYRQWSRDLNRFITRVAPHPTISYWGPYDRDRLVKANYIQTSALTVWGELARAHRMPTDRMVEEDWEYFKTVADVSGVGRPVFHLDEHTCRYHWAQAPGEQPNLMSTIMSIGAVPSMSAHKILQLGKPCDYGIGVVIPTKDRGASLTAALRSTCGCSVVVFDDGGRRLLDAAAVCQQFEYATLLRSDTSLGPSAARNRAIEHLETPWVHFLDDDDVFVPDWRTILESILSEGVDIVLSAAYEPNGQGGLSVSNDLYTSQICIRRELLMRVMFDEAVRWAEEREMIRRSESMGARIYRSDRPIVIRASRGGSGLAPGIAGGKLKRRAL